MKKGTTVTGLVERLDYPNRGVVVTAEGEQLEIKNVIPGQKVEAVVTKARHGMAKGRLKSILERSPLERAKAPCPLAGRCGGCSYQTLPYEEQLKIKEGQIRRLLAPAIPELSGSSDDTTATSRLDVFVWEGIYPSPLEHGFRNKMEFTFGDEYQGGPMTLGMHVRNSFYDVVTVDCCNIVDEDYRRILRGVLDYFNSRGVPHYHKTTKEGFLRYLIVRKSHASGEIMVVLITASGYVPEADFVETLRGLPTEGAVASVWHGVTDSVADTSYCEGLRLLYGKEAITDEVLGLKFDITPYSFFQTNTQGAEVLYAKVREYAKSACGQTNSVPSDPTPSDPTPSEEKDRMTSPAASSAMQSAAQLATQSAASPSMPSAASSVMQYATQSAAQPRLILDLYSGTGTIAQILAPSADEVIGVEIVEEAVRAARVNTEKNGLDNCRFICGDVFKTLDSLPQEPDLIILDPPREGVHPKAMERIASEFAPPNIVYISCKATSFVENLSILKSHGYRPVRGCCVDLFPGTAHVEVVSLLQRLSNTSKKAITLDVEMEEYHRIMNRTEVTADATE